MTQDMMTLRALLEKSSDADLLREMIGFTAERLMALEVEGLTGAAHGERSADRITHRNGYRDRSLGDAGRHGRVEDPEAEEGELLPGLPGAAADGREGAGCGDPGRPTSRACRPARSTIWFRRWGCRASPRARSPGCAARSTIRSTASSIDRWRATGPYLWLDATYVKVRQTGRIVSVAVTVAVAVNDQGRREVLGMAIGASEAETFWTEFLRSLARRGLRGVKLVISDDHKGLKAAATRILGATWQRCRVHFARNLLAHAGRQGRRVVSAFVATAFAQEDADSAKGPVASGRRPAQAQGPQAGSSHGRSEHDVLAYMSFPQGAPPEIALHKPDRTAPCRGQASHQRRRHLSQRSRHHTARRRHPFSSRTTSGPSQGDT